MKKIISLLASVSLLAATASVAYGADKEARQPDVSVNGTKIEFADQKAYITDEGRTLVPARGVFEAMGCSVDWNPETYEVTVAKDDKTVVLKIDSDIMKVTEAEATEDVTLEVPAQIMNDRTMVPLRAVSEAFDSIIAWNESQYTVYINTAKRVALEKFPNIMEIIANNSSKEEEQKEPEKVEIKEEDKINIELASNVEDVKAGDEFEVYIRLSNVPEGLEMTDSLIELAYDKTKFEYIEGSGSLLNAEGEEDTEDELIENLTNETGIVFLLGNINGTTIQPSGDVIVLKFKALTDEGGEISFSNNYREGVGHTVAVLLSRYAEDKTEDILYEGELANVSEQPLVIK